MRLSVFMLLCASAVWGSDYFPFAVWYGGGKARAPMPERDPKAKREMWRKDLKAIKGLGFNAIRCWIDWASGEPVEGRYNFETIDTLLELAEQEDLKVIAQIYMDAAPDWVGRKFPDSLYVFDQRRGDASGVGAGILPRPSRYCTGRAGLLDRARGPRRKEPSVPGLGFVERTARY
jgi:hypothetical protein